MNRRSQTLGDEELPMYVSVSQTDPDHATNAQGISPAAMPT